MGKQSASAAFSRIDALNHILSDYERDSELNRLSASAGSGKIIRVSDDLWEVLTTAYQVSEETKGAFDITVGPYVKLWRRARRRGELPEPDRLQQVQASVGYQYILLDSIHQSVQLTQPDMLLDLGGIAKGYALDEAMEVLKKHGITTALVDGGGDILVSDAPPGEKGWAIAIEGTVQNENVETPTSLFTHQSIASSGDLYQFLEVEGQRYSHILDPKTGIGMTTQIRVTILAPTGILADAYASAVSVLGVEKGLAFIENKPGVEALIMQKKDGEVKVWKTGGL
jgi:thiamine biosynthesis lipoprotein